MELIANGPQLWLFFKAAAGYYLSVRCQQSFAEFELVIKLNQDEYREYHALGHVYLDYLAARVSYWASEYKERDLSVQKATAVNQAVAFWKTAHPGANL